MAQLPPKPGQHVGIAYPRTVDLVLRDTQETYRLVVIEPGAWDGSHKRLLQLQEKLNTYIAFAVDGELESRYPDSVGKRVVIRLDLYAEPDPKTRAVMDKLGKAIEEEGLGFEVHVDPDR